MLTKMTAEERRHREMLMAKLICSVDETMLVDDAVAWASKMADKIRAEVQR